MSIAATIIITIALVFYSIGVWSERIQGRLKPWHLAFFILGANSDVLVGEGDYIYMRQKKMTPDLKEVEVDVLSSKGAQDVGLHIFSTSGLLDDSLYNRAFWMYSKRWPGFQLANQAPKTGQLLVFDDLKTYAVRVFYRRNVHSPMFFPAHEGYLVFADANSNEPQIVGEAAIALQNITGQSFGTEHDKWMDWLKKRNTD